MPIKEIQHICCDHCEPLGTWHAAHSTGCPPQPPQKRGKCVICNNEEPKTGHGDINAYCEKHWDYRFEYFPQPKAEWVEEIIPYLRKHSSGWGFVTDESIKMFEEQFVIPTISHAIKQAREEGYQKAKSEAKKFDLAVRYGELVYEVTANGLKVKAEEEVIQQERQRVIEILEGMKWIASAGRCNGVFPGKCPNVDDFCNRARGKEEALSDAIKEIKAQDIK